MSGDWAEVRLGDLITIKHGWPFASEFFSAPRDGLPIVVGIGNFNYTGGFRFDSTTLKGYTDRFPNEYILQPGDTLLVMTCQTAGGEILGIPGRIPNDGRTYLHNQRMGKVVINQPERIDQGFLYWLFLTQGFNRHLVVSASGTKILHTAPSRIESYRFRLPPLPIQRRIADILGALDDKIECNRRINQTLEAMAQALYKHWFVDFGPFRGGEFVDSGLGEIPQGWEARTLGDVVTIYDSVRVPLSSMERAKRKGVFPYYGATSVMDFVDDYLFDGTYVLLGEDGSVVKSDNTPFVQYVYGRFWVNNHAHVLQGANGVSTEFLKIFLEQLNVRPFVTGAVQPKINQENMRSVPFLKPPLDVCDKFNQAISPWYAQIRTNEMEIQTLIRTRDYLLPKLLSGEVEVKPA